MSDKNKVKKEMPNELVPMEYFPIFGNNFSGFQRSPFMSMSRFMDDMDRLFQGFNSFRMPDFDTTLAFPLWNEPEETWSPKIEVTKNKDAITVRAELPGMNREDINVELADDFLTLSGERKEEKEETKEDLYRTEFSYGSFYRRMPLPKGVKPEDAKAKFENGVLEINIAVPALQASPGKIEIQGATTEAPKVLAAKP